MLTVESNREPIRDAAVLSAIKGKMDGSLSKTLEISVDVTFNRAFSWFPNKAVPSFLQPLLKAYVSWTQTFLADPRDTIFVTHIIFGFLTTVPSSVFLLYNFSWIHAILHTISLIFVIPPFILMLHCSCHRRMSKNPNGWADFLVHYVLAPFYGETWNTFYYHHVKHHHVEDNGVLDLSSTIWYDRDNWLHFAHYFFRFFFFIGFELTYYFFKKGKPQWAINTFVGEYSNLLFYSSFFWICSDPKSVIFAWFVPLIIARIGMMTGNWTQHAFLDQNEATNDYKTALTVVESFYNTVAFNDGYHTSHHLNPVRHWQDHPEHFIANAEKFRDQRVAIFRGMDYWEIWCMLMTRNYDVLAKHFVDLTGKMTLKEKKDWLKARTKRLTPEQVELNYQPKKSE